MAQQLIDSLSSEFDPTKYRDDYRERVLDLIERKAAGEEIAVQPQAEEPAAAPDLMAALEASLAAVTADSDDTPAPAAPKPRKRQPPARPNGSESKPAKRPAKAKR